ncbi:MAG: hypothetical protein U0354_09830 [Candidatus Sericytochromatia bacterium]
MKQISVIDTTYADRWARWSYEQIIYNQPQIKLKGLYKFGFYAKTQDSNEFKMYFNYFVLCEEPINTLKTQDGEEFTKWFKDVKALTSPISLENTVPEGSVLMDERKINHLVKGSGNPRTVKQFFNELNLVLPRKIPEFIVKEGKNHVELDIIFKKKPRKYQLKKIISILESFEYPVIYNLFVDSSLNIEEFNESVRQKEKDFKEKYPRFSNDTLDLIISRNNRGILSKSLYELVQEDEEFWVSNREKVFSGKINNVNKILPNKWNEKKLRCFINALSDAPSTLRNYIPIFQEILIALPFAKYEEKVLKKLDVTFEQLIELSKIGKVKFLLPHSIDKYFSPKIENLANECPESIILSRRLASATIIDSKERFPLIYPPFGIKERREFFSSLIKSSYEVKDQNSRKVLDEFFKGIGQSWQNSEELINLRGAVVTPALGLGAIISSLIKTTTNIDMFLEFITASSGIDWGAPFNATVVPVSSPNNSIEELTEMIAYTYSGIRNESMQVFLNGHNKILEGILTINSDVDIIELSKEFKSSDISRLQKIILNLSQNKNENDNLQDAIDKFNNEVKRYEKNAKRLAQYDIKGNIRGVGTLGSFVGGSGGGLASLLLSNPYFALLGIASIPLLTWLFNYISIERSRNNSLAIFLDYIDANLNKKVNPDAVLVSRLKKRLEFI